jgi:hypothetical protein
LRIDVVGRCQKVPIFYFQSQFSMSKIIKIFLIFFPLENTHFLLLPLQGRRKVWKSGRAHSTGWG